MERIRHRRHEPGGATDETVPGPRPGAQQPGVVPQLQHSGQEPGLATERPGNEQQDGQTQQNLQRRPGQPGTAVDAMAGNTVQVISGALIMDMQLSRMTVGEARDLLQPTMRFAPTAAAMVDGGEAGANMVLQAGSTLEFVRLAAEKGACSW